MLLVLIKKLLDQLRERIRYCRYSLRTEQSYVLRLKRYLDFHGLCRSTSGTG